MRKVKINAAVIVFLLICFFVGASKLLKIDYEMRLRGAIIKAQYPELSISSILSGEYQNMYDDWFLENYPGRGYLVKAYNQFKYTFLRKSANDTIILQKDGSLNQIGYVESYLCIDINEEEYNDTIQKYDAYCQNLKSIQDELEERGKMFIYLIAPSKAEVYSEYIPMKYVLNSQNDIYKNTHEILIEFLNKYNVNYYDSTALMMDLKENSSYRPFSMTGIHWTYYASAETTEEFFETINSIYSINLPKPIVEDVIEMDKPLKETDKTSKFNISNDADIYYSLNLYWGKMDSVYTFPVLTFELPEDFEQLSLMRMGTSFDTNLHIQWG